MQNLSQESATAKPSLVRSVHAFDIKLSEFVIML